MSPQFRRFVPCFNVVHPRGTTALNLFFSFSSTCSTFSFSLDLYLSSKASKFRSWAIMSLVLIPSCLPRILSDSMATFSIFCFSSQGINISALFKISYNLWDMDLFTYELSNWSAFRRYSSVPFFKYLFNRFRSSSAMSASIFLSGFSNCLASADILLITWLISVCSPTVWASSGLPNSDRVWFSVWVISALVSSGVFSAGFMSKFFKSIVSFANSSNASINFLLCSESSLPDHSYTDSS